MATNPVHVDVRADRLEVTRAQHIDLIRHIYDQGSERELLRELAVRLAETERAGA